MGQARFIPIQQCTFVGRPPALLSLILILRNRLAQYLELSFSAETKTRTHFADYFWKPRSTSLLAPLGPLDFPHLLPSLSLVPQSALHTFSTSNIDETFAPISETHFNRVMNVGPPTLASNGIKRNPNSLSPGPPPSRSESELNDTLVFAFDGEVILKVLRTSPVARGSRSRDRSNRSSHIDSADGLLNDELSEHGSRSLSRAPSVSAAMSGSLARKASRASLVSRRSSLPSLSRGQSLMHSEAKPDLSLTVAVSGGTLDRLIDILVDGLEVAISSTDDSGLSVGVTRSLSVDRDDFQNTWWTTFRSFVSAFVFFEVRRDHPNDLMGTRCLTKFLPAPEKAVSSRPIRRKRNQLSAGECCVSTLYPDSWRDAVLPCIRWRSAGPAG